MSYDDYKLATPPDNEFCECGAPLSHRDTDGICKDCIAEEKADREEED